MKIYILYNVCVYEYLTYHNEDTNMIMKEMLNDEFYIIQDKIYDVFKPICINDKMIGFITGDFYEEDKLVLEIGYLLPPYRSQGLMMNTIFYLMDYFYDKKVWLELPNRYMMQSLLDNNVAFDIGEGFVLSTIPLSFRSVFDDTVKLSSRLYDLNHSCIVKLTSDGFLASPLLDVDCFCFDGNRDFSMDYRDTVCSVCWNYIQCIDNL